ncbi:carbonic anhydrase family protein [Galbibacter sp. EGI 63066]|uniref:carbonic anhydrase n=1 Tax=Galbibacter sp. EGI 63066 TaxID=2993559 RepID=UPI00224993FD|nr:carbonic anhydrase family protein [Galbibacter sp. EGI 63066]MCX2679341.1 carbonic anhydrase family protein [Galbibacter sp. EGI 63066]
MKQMKHHIFYISLILGLNFMTSCQNVQKKQPEVSKEVKQEAKKKEDKHWSYQGETGPEHWAKIEKNTECGGKYQSPIDIVGAQSDSNLLPLDIHYSSKTKIHNVTNNGHSIQFNFDPGDYIVLNGEKYELKQFHFHESAEHTIKGVRYPMVIHLVHVNKNGKYAVLAVMAEESRVNSESFDFLESYLPLSVKETKDIGKSFNMNSVLPEKKQYYTYEGSLTTPPCTEGVQWFIFKNPVDVSLEMIKELQEVMPVNNYRDIQPLNGRVVKRSFFTD